MAFRLPESLKTGFPETDEDHEVLISYVNAIARAEQSNDSQTLMARLHEFREELARHFQTEEAILREAGYPRVNGHARHHAEIIAFLDKLIRDIPAGEGRGGIAETCFHELVSVVLMRDRRFLNWLADRRMGK